MQIQLFLLLWLGIVVFDQTNAFDKFCKQKCSKCCSHVLRPKPLPWSKPMCFSKCDKLHAPANFKCKKINLPSLSVGSCKKNKLNFKNLHCDKPMFEDDCNGHKSGECLYEFCRDCKDFVHDKLVDLKHCVVNDICDKLKEKVDCEKSLCPIQPRQPPCSPKKTYCQICCSPPEHQKPPPPPQDCYSSCEAYPCDPVSMALAYKSSCKPISELKLCYGPCKRPQDEQIKEYHPRIPEERLYNCGKTVIELKHKNYQPPCDDADYDDESEEEPCYDDECPPHSPPCYKDIGYGPVQSKYCKFVPCQKESSEEKCSPNICPLKPPFKPGRIIYSTSEKPTAHCLPQCHHYHHHHHQVADDDRDDCSSEEEYSRRSVHPQRLGVYVRPKQY